MSQEDWKNSWESFVRYVTGNYLKGKSNDELSKEFGGAEITWIGKVRNLKLEEEYAAGIEIDMLEIMVNLIDSKYLNANYLFLGVNEITKVTWDKVKKGDTVEFNAKIKKYNGVFPQVQISIVDDEDEAVLMVGIEEARLLNVIK